MILKHYYKNAVPIGTCPLCNFGGLAILAIDGEKATAAYNFGDGYKQIRRHTMYDAADELKQLMRGAGWYESFIEIIKDILPAPENKKEYSRAERLKWRQLLLTFDAGAIDDDDATTGVLELITGTEYAAAEIRGCCQGDWNNIIYPAEYGREWLKEFEIEYFNMGDEWALYENGPDGEYVFHFYTHSWRDDEKRAEIADAAGVKPDDVILYAFDGWSRTPVYKEISA